MNIEHDEYMNFDNCRRSIKEDLHEFAFVNKMYNVLESAYFLIDDSFSLFLKSHEYKLQYIILMAEAILDVGEYSRSIFRDALTYINSEELIIYWKKHNLPHQIINERMEILNNIKLRILEAIKTKKQ